MLKTESPETRSTFVRVNHLQADLQRQIVERTRALEAAQRRLEKQQRELRALQAQYRTLVEQLPTITYVKTPDSTGSMLYVSPQIEKLLGFSPEEWVADPNRWTEQLHPDDRAVVLAAYPRLLDNGGHFHTEYRMLARDGRILWVRDDATLIRDDLGKPLVIQGVLEDISDHKRAETLLALSERFGAR